ncbi:hypothetical protein [Gracilibacillus sp. YIM 98692]|uniref:hypothetical protein n=1 Tax=Gracilibacillus sp. YIM 98692 TaxID=2663532 RepID=UPI0013D1A36F|nr:hypothetical protein [Gracilibacillus sp. YIM 98692]
MDTFSRNYWSLYLDFIKDFEKLIYKGFSLPYLCHLPSLILNNDKISNELKDKNYIRKLKHRVNDPKEFQEVFNHFIQSHQKPLVKNKHGKVVIHVDKLLRFPPHTLNDFLDPSNTILLTKGKKTSSPRNKSKVKKTSGKKSRSRKPAPSTNKKSQAKKTAPSTNNKRTVKKTSSSIQNKRKNAKKQSLNSKNKKYRSGSNMKAIKARPSSTNPINKKMKAVSLTNAEKQRKKNYAVKKRNNAVKKNTSLQKRFPYDHLFNYAIDTNKSAAQVQNQARKMLKAYKGHHFYKNKKFQTWFLNNIATVINHIEMTKNFLNKVPISCIVVSTTHSFINRILALVAAEKGIPTICMQHGIISSELGYIPKIATVDAVYGNFERDWFKKVGAPDQSTEVIGHPRFDEVFASPKMTRTQFNRKLGLDPKKKTLMIAARGSEDDDKWRTLIQTISKKINLNILIKNYPSKTPHKLTKEFSFVYPTQGYTIYDIFPHVDAVVTYSSTVGLEAMLAQKSVFILNTNFSGYTGYYKRLGKLVQADPRILAKLIISYFTNRQISSYAANTRKKFLAYAYPNLSKSGARLKNLINKLTT